MKTKTNIKKILKTILAIIIVLALIGVYNHHQDVERAEYARSHVCTWYIAGAHDICR